MEIALRPAVLAIALGCICSASAVAEELHARDKMVNSEDIAKRYLTIDEERFFVFGEQDENAIVERFRFKNENFLGLAVAAPALVDLQARSRVPVVIFFQADETRAWDMSSDDNLAVIAISHGTGVAYAGRVKYSEKREAMRKKPARQRVPPPPDLAKAMHYGVYSVDLLQSTFMPSAKDSYTIRALEFDWLSNAVEVQVTGKPALAPTEMNGPGLDVSRFRKESLVAPADGLALSVSAISRPGAARVAVSGAGRIVLPKSATVLREATPDGARALVRSALLIAQKDDTPPAIVEMTLPVFGSTALKPGDNVEIYFTQDIADVLGAAGVDHRVYWVLDRYISAPAALKAAER
jgi:hypothetical protein